MELLNFSASGFRNLSEVEMKLSPGMNVVHGENAQGKTNLLEAIFCISTLKSFRTKQLSDALSFGRPEALLQATVCSRLGNHSLLVSFGENKKISMLDHKKADPVHYLGVFNVFLFCFPMLEVVRGGPEERRRFLDRSLAMSKPGYLAGLVNYHRALRQKNSLLVSVQRREVNWKEGMDQIASFNDQLLEHGLPLARDRAEYIERLQALLNGKRELFFRNGKDLSIEYHSTFLEDREQVRKNLDRFTREREVNRGHSVFGIHRDEILLSENGKELRRFGSSGQHRAFLLLLLLAQLELYEAWRQDRPVLLLDDLDSELDEGRIHRFIGEIGNRYQTLISSSREELFGKNPNMRLFEIESGKLLERN
jgi:DNA replication and repair protein RecF